MLEFRKSCRLLVLGMMAILSAATISSGVFAQSGTGPPDLYVRPEFKDPDRAVKVQGVEGTPHYRISKNFTPADLPKFYRILKDPSRTALEHSNAEILISLISPHGNAEAVSAIAEFMRTRVDWKKIPMRSREETQIIAAKWHAPRQIGFIGGDAAVSLLRGMLSAEKTSETTRAWLGKDYDERIPQFQVNSEMRGQAAIGLAFSCKRPEIRALVKSEYEREVQKGDSASNPRDEGYIDWLLDAMATMSIVDKLGLDGYAAMQDDPMAKLNAYQANVPNRYSRSEGASVVK